MNPPDRDRDQQGRPRSARPRDALGRPLARTGTGPAVEDLELARLAATDFPVLLAAAQQLLDDSRPFEAHELLEAAWKRVGEQERPLWRALAQLAVGVTHLLRGNVTGADAVLTRSAEELQRWSLGAAGRAAPHRVDAPGLAVSARRMVASHQPERVRLTL